MDDDILEVREDFVRVKSHKTGNERRIPRRDFQNAWAFIEERHEFVPSRHKKSWRPSGQKQYRVRDPLLSRYVEAEVDPVISVRLRREFT